MNKENLIEQIRDTATETKELVVVSNELEEEISRLEAQHHELEQERDVEKQNKAKLQQEVEQMQEITNTVAEQELQIESAKKALKELMETESRIKAVIADEKADKDVAESERICENMKQQKRLEQQIIDDQQEQKELLMTAKNDLIMAERQILQEIHRSRLRAVAGDFRIMDQLDRGCNVLDWW